MELRHLRPLVKFYRLISHPFAWVVGYGLLVGAGRLHSGFIHGPGEYFLPILLFGIVGGFVLGYRRAGQDRFPRGTVWAMSFIGCLYVPYLLYWGWLEWRVRTVPVPPNTGRVSRFIEPIRFTGHIDWGIEGQVNLPAEAIERYTAPGKLRNYRELRRVRDEMAAGIENFYQKRFAAEGWTVGATINAPLLPTSSVDARHTTFTRDGATMSLRVIPDANASYLTFSLQRDDPMPFGPVELPGLPWNRRPARPFGILNAPGG